MPRRILEGEVVGNQNDKSITVLVERRYMHPVYKKYVKRTDKYAAHDENNSCEIGQKVSIIECAPISKRKRWTLVTGEEVAAAAPAKKEAKPAEKKEPAKKPAAKKTTAKKKDA